MKHRGMRRPDMMIGSHKLLAAAAAAALLIGSSARASVLLNDSFADGDRTNTNLPTDSADYAGLTTGATLTETTGKLAAVPAASSYKLWTYFTSDQSAPDGNQPHNAVTHLNVGDTLTTSVTVSFPNGVANGTTGRDFRVGLFFDPTDARVQSDVNSDGGGSTAPWTDATGYVVQIPLNSATNTTSLFQLGKRTTSNASLAGSGSAYTFAPSGGSPVAIAASTDYTLQIVLNVVSASELDVTANWLQGSSVLSTLTEKDLGNSFGGASIASGLLSGSQGIYQDFDQLFMRIASNAEATEYDFKNFEVELTSAAPAPEPASVGLMGLAATATLLRRRRQRA